MSLAAPAVIERSWSADGPCRRPPPEAQRRLARSSRAQSKMGGVSAGRSRPAPPLKAVLPGPVPRQGQRSLPSPAPTGPNVRSGPAGIRRSAFRAHRSQNGNGPRSAGRLPITDVAAAPTSQLRAQMQPSGGFSSGV
ncbi:hypothetical protein NDU88_002254 [Pleurodeles waltl]|uniref:Uncharacterized protein n=1 Tax=Pleurodeles waltl TaxID=8319 RepID=A0AAV7UCM9_PLEWA|nr:hypothetical protein NDU88_002254 [Pleurodeles waltl]